MSEYAAVPPVPPRPPAARGAALERLAGEAWDVLVVGGGITGAGIALDAAVRGFKVALVERDDLASGTSSRSSSLVHGGLRYLEQGALGLMRESATERDLLRRLAPHLVRPMEFTIPWSGPRRTPLVGIGLWAYDGIAGFRSPSLHQRLSAHEVVERLPGLVRHLDGHGYAYGDCRTDDARLVLQVARTAERFGALVVTRAEVTELRRAGGRVVGAQVRDRVGGDELGVAARHTVAATGVWADALRAMAGGPAPMLSPSKGVHLVFPAELLRVRSGGILPSTAGDGRSVFLIPWQGQVVVGTTDDAYDGPLDAPSVDPADAAYLCAAVNDAFGTALGPHDAVGAYAGLRPLLRGQEDEAVGSDELSRRHALIPGPEGLTTVTGGKLTTYRRMAEDTVDAVVRALGGSPRRTPGRTRGVRLGLRGDVDAATTRVRDLCERLGLDPAVAGHLVARHGDEAVEVVELAARYGETDELVPGLPYLAVEARWAVEREHALSVADVLQRRTRAATRDRSAGLAAAPRVAALLAAAHGWTAAQAEVSVAEHARQVAGERGAVPLTGAPRATAL